jgi:hypothetical protein
MELSSPEIYSNTPTASYSFRVERKQIQLRSQMAYNHGSTPLEERWEVTISELIEWFLKDDTGESKARIAQLCAIIAYADSNNKNIKNK